MTARSAVLVTTSVARIPGTNRSTGAYASELAESWSVLRAAGFEVHVASVAGGTVPVEAFNEGDPTQAAMFADAQMVARLQQTRRPDEVVGADHDVLVLVGGHGAVYDLADDDGVARLVSEVFAAGGVVVSVCHGAAGLLRATGSDGAALLAGRRVAAFSDDEEHAVGMLAVVPFLLSERLTGRGAVHDVGPSFLPHVVEDGRLVSGQNPASTADAVAAAVRLAIAAPIAAG